MSVTASTPDHRTAGDGAPDKLDRMLTDYFRSELPRPWPASPRPSSPRPAVAFRAGGLSHSRLVLAASIASLLLGGWLLTGKLSSGPVGPGLAPQDGRATVPLELRRDSGGRAR
jgi:hypothetical protein